MHPLEVPHLLGTGHFGMMLTRKQSMTNTSQCNMAAVCVVLVGLTSRHTNVMLAVASLSHHPRLIRRVLFSGRYAQGSPCKEDHEHTLRVVDASEASSWPRDIRTE